MIVHIFNPGNRGQYLVKIKANTQKITSNFDFILIKNTN